MQQSFSRPQETTPGEAVQTLATARRCGELPGNPISQPERMIAIRPQEQGKQSVLCRGTGC